MLVKSARIKNFRSLRDVSLTFGRQTVLVGGNGAGKSAVLRAIELFYAPSLSHVRDIDFYDKKEPIEIELTFSDFTEGERELFEARISADQMTVVRVIEPGGGKNNGRYFGMTRVHVGFEAIHQLSGKEKKEAFNGLPRDQGLYADLEKAQRMEQIDLLIAEWEAAHPEECELGRDNGQFLGFQNVGRGALQKATSFVLIPAVRDASADAQDGKNTVVGQLMELIVRSAIQSRKDIQDFQAEITERFAQLTDPANLPELGGLADEISATLGQLYSNAAVALKWKAAEAFTVPLPGADVGIVDEDIEIPVDRTGHGLQRAFVMSLLQHLARAQAAGSVDAGEGQQSQDVAAVGAPVLPGLILAVEEPELYQHPTKQRHFARVLRKLAAGSLPGMATATQLMFATHSPYFVSIENFNEVRILRRGRKQPEARRETVACAPDLEAVAAMLGEADGQPAGAFTAATLQPRLHIIDNDLAEGFFANAVALVEGPGDRAALIAAAALTGRSFEEEGIAILPVGGKNNLDKPWAIFRSLGIPVYVMWDGDHGKAGAAALNHKMQKLIAASEPHVDYPQAATERYACHLLELEAVLQTELGAELFNTLLDKFVAIYDLPGRSTALKNPEVMSMVLLEASKQGVTSKTLATITNFIFGMVPDMKKADDQADAPEAGAGDEAVQCLVSTAG